MSGEDIPPGKVDISKKFQIFILQSLFEHRHQIHLRRIIFQILSNDSALCSGEFDPDAPTNFVRRKVLSGENFKFLREKRNLEEGHLLADLK